MSGLGSGPSFWGRVTDRLPSPLRWRLWGVGADPIRVRARFSTVDRHRIQRCCTLSTDGARSPTMPHEGRLRGLTGVHRISPALPARMGRLRSRVAGTARRSPARKRFAAVREDLPPSHRRIIRPTPPLHARVCCVRWRVGKLHARNRRRSQYGRRRLLEG